MTREKNHPFQMRVSPDWLERLDDWRRQQPNIPSRAEAIRILVEQGMDAHIARHPVRDHVGSRTFHQDPVKN